MSLDTESDIPDISKDFRLLVRAMREFCSGFLQKEMPLNIFMESIADAYNDLKRLLDTTESLRKSAGDCDLTDHEGEQRLRVRVIKVYVEAFLEKEITLFRQTAAIYNIIEEITEAESPSKKSPDTE